MHRFIRLALFLAAGLASTAAMLYALQSRSLLHENRYQELLRLERTAKETHSLEELQTRAAEIGAKVVRRYRELEYLSFRDENRWYWCKTGSFASTLPMNWWRYRKRASIARVFNTRHSLRLEIASPQEQPLLTFLRSRGHISEYRWPIGGTPGACTSFDEVGYNKNFRLGEPLHPGDICNNGLYMLSQIGPQAKQPAVFKRFFDYGIWVGTTQVDGRTCDVLLSRFDPDEDRDFNAFYIEPSGLILVWIQTGVIDDPNADVMLKIKHYTDYKTDPIPPEVFEPDPALLEAAKDWRKLSDAESLAEWKAARGK